jgi:hypothetical protein
MELQAASYKLQAWLSDSWLCALSGSLGLDQRVVVEIMHHIDRTLRRATPGSLH